jgi:hypothetical protein
VDLLGGGLVPLLAAGKLTGGEEGEGPEWKEAGETRVERRGGKK